MLFETSKQKWVLPKNGLIIALGRLVELLEKNIFETSKQKLVLSKNGLRIAVARLVKLLEKMWVLSKNGLRIALGRLVKLLEKKFWDKKKKSEYLPKMVLELLWDA